MNVRLCVMARTGMVLTILGGTLWMWRDISPDPEGDALSPAEGSREEESRPAEFLRYPGAELLLRHKRLEAEKLDAELAVVERRAVAKEQIAIDLVAGRLGLLEAAARFRELDTEVPDANPGRSHLSFPGHSDEERYCRQVIYHVQSLLDSLSQTQAATIARLQAELEGRLDKGSLHLPIQSPANEDRGP
jgi:hypothetical protein